MKRTTEFDNETIQVFKKKIKQLAKCDEIISVETINAIGEITKDVETAKDNAPSSDEFDEDFEENYRNLKKILELPNDTYSLTEIKPEFPPYIKYGVRSGLIHLNVSQFSPLSRGYQVVIIIKIKINSNNDNDEKIIIIIESMIKCIFYS